MPAVPSEGPEDPEGSAQYDEEGRKQKPWVLLCHHPAL